MASTIGVCICVRIPNNCLYRNRSMMWESLLFCNKYDKNRHMKMLLKLDNGEIRTCCKIGHYSQHATVSQTDRILTSSKACGNDSSHLLGSSNVRNERIGPWSIWTAPCRSSHHLGQWATFNKFLSRSPELQLAKSYCYLFD